MLHRVLEETLHSPLQAPFPPDQSFQLPAPLRHVHDLLQDLYRSLVTEPLQFYRLLHPLPLLLRLLPQRNGFVLTVYVLSDQGRVGCLQLFVVSVQLNVLLGLVLQLAFYLSYFLEHLLGLVLLCLEFLILAFFRGLQFRSENRILVAVVIDLFLIPGLVVGLLVESSDPSPKGFILLLENGQIMGILLPRRLDLPVGLTIVE